MKKTLLFLTALFSIILITLNGFANNADNKEKAPKIRIDNQSYELIAPTHNPDKLAENSNKLQQLLAQQKQISDIIQSSQNKQILDQQFDLLMPLMIEQDKLIKDIFVQGIYSQPFLTKFISFRKQFAIRLKQDFAKFTQAGIVDGKNARRLLEIYDATSSEYESAFLLMQKLFL